MPIATPDKYDEMIDRAKAAATPSRPQRDLVADAERRDPRLCRGRVRRHHPGLHRRRRVLGGLGQGHGGRLAGPRRVRPRGRQVLWRQHRPAHGPLPQGQARRLRPAAARRLRGRGRRRRATPLPVPHVGRLRETLEENLRIAADLLPRTAAARTSSRWRSAPSAARRTASKPRSTRSSTRPSATRWPPSRPWPGEKGRYICRVPSATSTASTSRATSSSARRSSRTSRGRGAKIGKENPFDLVFHGGSGSTGRRSPPPLDYGVIKMNIDTDTQYAFTRPSWTTCSSNYDGVLKVDGEVGNKKLYDPAPGAPPPRRPWPPASCEAAQQLGSAGKSLK